MSVPPFELLRRRLPCDESAPLLAREAFRGIAEIDPVRDDAVLVVSELVTNAVMHSGCGPAEDLEVVAQVIPQGVRIAVTDVGRSTSTPAPRTTPARRGGLGLRLVETLAESWGTEHRRGRRVWADITLARSFPHGEPAQRALSHP
jgi:anti-sigma regulatory factor (Ser/Thr protein kinase)